MIDFISYICLEITAFFGRYLDSFVLVAFVLFLLAVTVLFGILKNYFIEDDQFGWNDED